MPRETMRRGAARAGALLLAAAALLALAPAALAVQTDQYDPFTACPTGHPALNDPAAEFAICAAGSGPGELAIGDRTVQLQRIGVQFAATGTGTEEPDCPKPGVCFGKVPGTTTLEDAPSTVWVGSPGNPKANPGKGKGLQLKVTLEAAGDLSAFSPAILFGTPLPLYELPLKLDVEAPWLGDDCYVGSDQNPIVHSPWVTGQPGNFEFLSDPNGFPLELIKLIDVPLEDKTLALPRARDCGHGGARSDAKANAQVNELLGLPSAAGLNKLVLPQTDLALVGAPFDGQAPDGGAALQAAFEAAK